MIAITSAAGFSLAFQYLFLSPNQLSEQVPRTPNTSGENQQLYLIISSAIRQEYKWAETGKEQRKLNVLASLHMGALVTLMLNTKGSGVDLIACHPNTQEADLSSRPVCATVRTCDK